MSKSKKAITEIVFDKLRMYQVPPSVTPDSPSALLAEYAEVAQTVHTVSDGCIAKAKQILKDEIACTTTRDELMHAIKTLNCAAQTVGILKTLIIQQIDTELNNEVDNVDLSDLNKAS